MKKKAKKHQNAKFIDEKLKTKSLMFFVSFLSWDLQDFKFQYVNHKAFGASFLYWDVGITGAILDSKTVHLE